MIATFKTNANDLDIKFLDSLKALFCDSRIRTKVESKDILAPGREDIDDRIRHIESGGLLIGVSADALDKIALGDDERQ